MKDIDKPNSSSKNKIFHKIPFMIIQPEKTALK